MTAKWQPSDDELDGLARTIEPPELDAEQLRTSLLANAANVRQQSRGSRAPIYVAVGAIVAAAAAALIWFNARDPERLAPRADVVAIGPASHAHEQQWPDYRVRLDDGRLQIDVMTVEASQHFTALTSDARIETRASKFVVGAEQKQLASIDVHEGRVELTYSGSTIILAAGQTWRRPVRTAETVVIEPPVVEKATEPPTPAPRKSKRVEASKATNEPPKPPAPSESTPKPGELDFRAGVAALRNGDAAGATKSFASACAAARKDALGEDACFWVGAAAKRAGQANAARDALARFLAEFPSSARTGEASALLGWLLYEANELDAAETRFQKAAADPVPKVRESAERGLEAIKRRRTK